jgi:hypothetical protein
MLKGSQAKRPPAKKRPSLSELCEELEVLTFRAAPGEKHGLTERTYTDHHLVSDLCGVREAFQNRFRRRFGIYDALEEAYRLYWKWRTRGNVKDIVTRTALFVENPPRDEADLHDEFWVLIELAAPAKNLQEQKNNSKYRRRLRIAAKRNCPPEKFINFTKKTGGINPPKTKPAT